MPETTENQFDGGMEGFQQFVLNAQRAAQTNGACILEYFTCAKCNNKQTTAHPFRSSVPCAGCGRRMKSRVPRLPTEGEVTKDMLTEAIRLVRRAFPTCNESTKQWIEKHDGAVRTACIAYGAHEVHRALNAVEEMARAMSGGHEPA